MKGFLYNDVKGIILSLLLKNNNIGIVKAIKTNVEKYTITTTTTTRKFEGFLQYCNSNWYRNISTITYVGHRTMYLSLWPSTYFIYDTSNGVYTLSQISIINGSVYLFVRDKLESIEQYGHQDIKTYKDIYIYIENMYK